MPYSTKSVPGVRNCIEFAGCSGFAAASCGISIANGREQTSFRETSVRTRSKSASPGPSKTAESTPDEPATPAQ